MAGKYREINIYEHARFNLQALRSLANELRPGHSCACDVSQRPKKGGYDWAIFLDFNDGVQWVFRVPLESRGTMIPPDLGAELIRSEVATMKYVAMNTDIPVPAVFAYSPTKHEKIEVPFILMSKAEGESLMKYWDQVQDRLDIKRSIVYQLGQTTWKLASHRFNRIGSLFQDKDTFKIGECLARGRVVGGRNYLSSFKHRAFESANAFYGNLMSLFLKHAQEMALHNHCLIASTPLRADYKSQNDFKEAEDCRNDFVALRQKTDSATNRADYVIAGNILFDLLRRWRRTYSDIPLINRFPLHHPDLSANNVFVDEQYRITCIIDWLFCTAVPLEVTFTPPGLPQSRHELDDHLANHFHNGLRKLLRLASGRDEEQIALNAGRLCQDSQFISSLYHLLSFDSRYDFRLLEDIWKAIQPSDAPSLESHFTALRLQSRLLHGLVSRVENSEVVIKRKERNHFEKRVRFDRAIAAKLHVQSDWDVQYDSAPWESRLTRKTKRARHCLRSPGN